ncbi:MAG: S-layer homology domain-containing protein, partial [Oscillospiraceae bacterium]|nr:S-layer homology domain-containing protein [Oscillospiraceae bacterium]
MNNLKRILSLALATVMVIGMMVVGASAADYPDADKIVNKDAVETLGALGIMNGDERGFRPQDGLTRAEAAKMLTKIHNKGVDVNFGVKDTPTFKDTDGHWAEGIIEYAAAFGIANGKGNGIFDPQGELTVAQLARMLLNMMGYTEGQTGSDWELKTTVLANNLGLFADLKDFLPTGKVTRDNAAQILVNAINEPLADGNVTTEDVYTLTGTDEKGAAIKLDFDSSTAAYLYASINKMKDIKVEKTTSKKAETLATKYLSLKDKTGIVTASKKQDDGTYKVTVGGTDFTKLTTDYTDMLGRKVKVLYKSESAVYGINTADA